MRNDESRPKAADAEELAVRPTGELSTKTDGWISVLGDVGALAAKIADTDFVPAALRGSVAGVAAAILTGRELGLPPMTSLAHVHVIKGKPGLSAQVMRQLILEAGHSIEYVETTDTRCVLRARRRGSERWQEFRFTADQAKKAGIDLGKYPEDKIVARATSRMARRMFADVLGGTPYTPDELADGIDGDGQTLDAPQPPPPATRTARRSTPVKPATATRTTPARATKAQVVVEEVDFDDEEPVEAEIVDDPTPQQEDDEPKATARQLTAMGAAFSDIGWTDRGDRLRAVTAIVRQPVASSKDLTKTQAGAVIDTLAWCQRQDDPSDALTQIIATRSDVDTDTGELLR